ncbi:MAG: hypothetical protein A3K19_33345 [Lentisphaerae bacterium RIFOXYB12_FULL_65_16]|nr:MAG: hypothetical protein A3K18_05830 [Lentisphaerae bacterium RIFOXYA12_64_32]OGV86917.1 MAG: hypothetical protein A3K19_33345 [Lentisphaerae bacterium RIFOXYB12_FULL_65_16]
MVTIRRYRREDREIVKDITAASFSGRSIDENIEKRFGRVAGKDWRWRKKKYVDVDLALNPEGAFVAELDGAVVGYITTEIDKDASIGRILNFAVLSTCQKQGIGRRLMEAALAYFRETGMEYAKIETLVQNEIGAHFYPKVGFEEIARQIHYVMPMSKWQPQSEGDGGSE